MSVEGDNSGLPEVEETQLSEAQPLDDHLANKGRDLAYQPGDNKVVNAQGDVLSPLGDAAVGAGILAKWAQTSKLFGGKANEEALNNYREHLDPSFVVALEWAQQDPDSVRKFLGSMKNALG